MTPERALAAVGCMFVVALVLDELVRWLRRRKRPMLGPPLHEWVRQQDGTEVCAACHEVMTWDGPNTNANGECYPCGKCGQCRICELTGVRP